MDPVWMWLEARSAWSLAAATIFFALVTGGTTFLAQDKRENLSLWLLGALDDDRMTWTLQFGALFDRIMGDRHFSWRCFLVSCLFSVIAVGLIWALLGQVLQVLDTRTATKLPVWQVLLFGAAINVLPDYISLYQTRLILGWFERVRSVLGQLAVLVLDAIMTGAIIVVGIAVFVWLFGDPIGGRERVSWVEMAAIVSPYAVFFYSTFFTSVWAWLYWISTGTMKLFTRTGLNRWLDVANKPGASLGITGAILILLLGPLADRAMSLAPDDTEVWDAWFCEQFPRVMCVHAERLTEDEAQKLNFLTMACENGANQQCVEVGIRLFQIDNSEAARLWRLSCDRGDLGACSDLGFMYGRGLGVEQDHDRALALFMQACEGGEAQGCYNLGATYNNGIGVPKDKERATAYHTQGCEGGHSASCGSLGRVYEEDEHVWEGNLGPDDGRLSDRDPNNDESYYDSHKLGGALGTFVTVWLESEDFDAYLHVLDPTGRRIKDHDDIAEDNSNAKLEFQIEQVGIYEIIANSYSSNDVGRYRLRVQTTPPYHFDFITQSTRSRHGPDKVGITWAGEDFSRAVELFLEACEGGNALGCTNLGSLYHDGLGVDQNYEQAIALYIKACDGGNALGCSNLGILYEKGLGVDQNYEQAFALYIKACDGGNAFGCSNLGNLYYLGLGVDQNFEQAIALYIKACDGGNALGCSNLGYAHYVGANGLQDSEQAAALFRQGCDGGDALGCTNLAYLHRLGFGVEQDGYWAAIERYVQACDGEDVLGCQNAGLLYEINENTKSARDLFHKACELDYQAGCDKLKVFD